MYIVGISGFIPETVVPNSHFSEVNGLTEEWILSRTGIRERRKVGEGQNTNTMAVDAVKSLEPGAPFPLSEVDLIVGGTYTPYDTIHTLAHAVQKYIHVSDIPVLSLSSACSSFANAMEIVAGYFAMGKSKKALVVLSDHNTAYSDETDKVGGHLWGDGACALLVTDKPMGGPDFKVKDIITGGAGNIGKASDGVFLRPAHEGFMMQHGRDVFQHACQYMAKVTRDILAQNEYSLEELDFFVPHQANMRITRNVGQNLGLREDQALSNIQYLGNTGCAGCSIALYENLSQFKPGHVIVVAVFGGGYSYGAVLLEC